MEQAALAVNAVIAIVVYGVICYLCAFTLWTRRSTWIVGAFLHLAGWTALAVVVIYALNLVGYFPTPVPVIIGRNVVVAIGGVVGLAVWIIRNALTRPR